MINKLKTMELEYVRCFAEEKRYESHIEFRDYKFKNTYTSNVSVLSRSLKDDELVKLINAEVNYYKRNRKDFLNFEINEEIKGNILKSLKIRPERIDKFNYFIIENKKYTQLEEGSGLEIRKAVTKEDFEELTKISIKDNEKILGRGYSRHRIKRKIEAYKDKDNNLEVYLCCKDKMAAGSCELLIKDGICKLEDFGILEEYRRQGLGTQVIRSVLKSNYQRGIKYTYVITEKGGMAEKLYKRVGFVNCGVKTQLIW